MLPTKPDPQELLKMMKTIYAETKKEMKGENCSKIVQTTKDKFIRLFKGAKELAVVATLRNDAYDRGGDNEWEIRTDET